MGRLYFSCVFEHCITRIHARLSIFSTRSAGFLGVYKSALYLCEYGKQIHPKLTLNCGTPAYIFSKKSNYFFNRALGNTRSFFRVMK